MKKIFTKLFLLTTLLMVSSQVWAQDPLVMCLRTDRQTIKRTVSRKDLIYNLPGPGSTLYVHLKSNLTFTYSISGYSEHDCGGDVTTIVPLRTTTELSKSYDIEGKGYKSIKLIIYPGAQDVELCNLEIRAKYANIPNQHTFDNAGYNSANASKSFTMDYYGAPPTINYEYITGDGYSGSEKFPISFAYSNGKITMNVQYLHNEVGTHKAEIKLRYSTSSVPTSFYVSGTTTKTNQTIAWDMGNKTVNVGDQLTLDATASSGLGVTYTSSNTSAVTVSGNTLTAVGEGNATITASQAGNSNYNAATSKSYTVTVSKKNQSITWTPPTVMTVGDTHTLSASAPGGTVAFAITGDAATLVGNTLTAVQAGSVTITASQSGNNYYKAAANVTKTITVNKATPSVNTWPTITAVTYGTTLEQALKLVGGSATVDGTFAITDTYTAATVPNAGTHTYNLEFRPTESNKYNNVAGGTATLTVNKADQAIAWTATPPTEMTVGDSHTLSATALGGAVAFAITGDAAKLAENTLTAVQAGTVTITASQAGNGNYNAAANVTHTITINKATPTVTAWPTLDTVTYGATLEQALVLVGGTASVKGTFVITDSYNAADMPNAGTHTYNLEFRPTESNKYNNVAGGTATLTVNKANQAIAWTATPPTEMTVGDSHTLSATAPGGAVAFDISGDAATLADNTLTAVQAGTVTITASQAGNSNYNPATDITYTVSVSKATPTVTAWPTLNAVTYGATLEQALVLVGGTASVAGTFVITDSYNAADAPNAGTHTYGVEFRPTESNKYNNVSGGTATLTVNRAGQAIAWTATPPTEMTVGDSHTLSATAPGGAVAFAISGDAATLAGNTLTAVQAGTVTITASQAGNGNYNAAANVTHTITINKATPTVTAWPTLDTVTYGATLEHALVLVSGTASVEGTFVITDTYTAATVPNAGAHTYSVEFRPTESNKYNNVSGGTATLTVNKADQVIAWTATPPTEMTVGDSHTLSATAPGGAVSYAVTGNAVTRSGNTLTAVQAGTVTITASQAGNSNYNEAANVTHTITINKATPTVSAWPTLGAVTYGATLEQALVLVGGTASVEGTFVVTDSYNAADAPNAGTHTYNLEFRPTESNKYNNVAGGTATLTVNKANQTIAWTPPTEMTVGDIHTLSATATSGDAVAFAVTGDAAKLDDNTLTAVKEGTVTITASQAGNGNYNAAANVTKTITVNKATPTVTAWPTLNAVTYGAKLEQALVLVGGTASVAGTFVITDSYNAADVPNAGTHTYNLEFRPTESNKYNNVAGGTATLTVNKANQTIAWTPPTEMTVGDIHTLSATATSGDAVAFAISGEAAKLDDNTLTAVKEGTVTITASQAGNGNYNAAANVTHTITINKATPTVTAWPTLDTVTYGATLEQALVLVGGTASVEGTFVITDSYNAADAPNAGTHTYNLEFRPTESNKYNNVSGGTATLTVNKADQVIAWDFADYTLLIGKTLELDATATCGAVTYVVNGTAISVSGTILTAMEEGTATIKATCAGDTNYNDVESMEYTITVEKDDDVTTGLDNTPSPMTNGQKIIYNGQLLIIRDGKTYNVLGVPVE